MTLPGETLSRYRGERSESDRGAVQGRSEAKGHSEAQGRGEARSSDAGSEVRGRDRRRERDEKRGRGRERLTPEEAVLPGVTSQHEPEAAAQPFSDDVPGFEVAETEARMELEHHAHEDVLYTAQTDVAPLSEEALDLPVFGEIRRVSRDGCGV